MKFKEILLQEKVATYTHYTIEYNPNQRLFVIGDIHGCSNTFKALLEKINLNKEDYLVLLGDYVNKGPDSYGVLDTILDLVYADYLVYPLCGNHESMTLRSVHEKSPLFFYPFNPKGSIPQKYPQEVYANFFLKLPIYYWIGGHLMVHAGLNLAASDPFTDYESMFWVRNFHPEKPLGFRLFHGHDPERLPSIEQTITERAEVINLDNGCFAHDRWFLGNLLCLEVNSNCLYVQPNID